MKKFYSFAVITLGFLCMAVFAKAQYSGTYETVAAGGDASNPATWITVPPNITAGAGGCGDCLFILHGTVNMDIPDAYIFGNSKIIVEPNTIVNVNSWMELDDNTQVLVGADATVNANDEIDLYDNAQFILADVGATLNALNLSGNSPIGPNTATWGSGVFYLDPTLTVYLVLTAGGYGAPSNVPVFFQSQYNLNCDVDHTCAPGLVYGPAKTQFVGTDNSWEFVLAPPTPLPVNLVQFAASINSDKTVLLSWSTAQETNSDHFELQRSANGNNFQPIGTVKAKGFSSITTNYSFTDTHPLGSVNYYRLKMVDQDTKYEFSKVITVTLDGNTAPLVVYNNPFTDQIRIKLNTSASDNLSLVLTDVQGKTYLRQSYKAQSGDNFINIYPPAAASGLYILSIKGSRVSQTIKLVKQ